MAKNGPEKAQICGGYVNLAILHNNVTNVKYRPEASQRPEMAWAEVFLLYETQSIVWQSETMSFDEREFRNALSHFATGVAIVTANVHNQLLGATISSFNSVSLSPPLVLFSIARSAHSLAFWQTVENYGVTVLGDHQTELSNRFARAGGDKWKDLEIGSMENGAPLLPDWLAYFACEAFARYDGGDHEIFVGRVLNFRYRQQAAESRPLVFFQGRYRTLESDNSVRPPPEIDAWSHAW